MEAIDSAPTNMDHAKAKTHCPGQVSVICFTLLIPHWVFASIAMCDHGFGGDGIQYEDVTAHATSRPPPAVPVRPVGTTVSSGLEAKTSTIRRSQVLEASSPALACQPLRESLYEPWPICFPPSCCFPPCAGKAQFREGWRSHT